MQTLSQHRLNLLNHIARDPLIRAGDVEKWHTYLLFQIFFQRIATPIVYLIWGVDNYTIFQGCHTISS